MHEASNYRSQGLTRKVLIAMHNAPFGCYMVAAAVVSALTAPLTFRVLDWLVERVAAWLR